MDEIKPRKNHHHHHHHHHHNQDSHPNRYTKFDDSDRNTDESRGPHCHHQHSRYLHDSPHHDAHYPRQFHPSEEDEILYDHHTPVTLSRASSSSLSSSSSSSSWYTESSANDPFSLHHAERPQHSLSCSNITDVHVGLREDEGSLPVVFATIKNNKKGSMFHESSQQTGNSAFSALDRSHSRSDEAFLKRNVSAGGEQSRHNNCGPLYKTSSLNRCLAFSDEDILLGVSSGPKRAVSSCQLPSKGILKNKENHTDIRKAKSMEVLSPRVANGQGPGQKGKGVTQSEIEQARANFVQGKLQFSAFLDEITKQVISPSDLSILGMNSNKSAGKTSVSAPTSNLIKPQLPPKKHREGKGEALKLPSRQEKGPFSSSRKHSDSSNPDKLISYAARNHHGSPPPRHYLHSASQNSHMESIPKDRRPISGDRFGRCGPHLTDGTNTSPESSQPKQRHHHRKQHYGHHPHNQLFPQLAHLGSGHQDPSNSPPSSAQGAGPGIGSESSSTKSDSSRTRDTVSTATSHSSEQSGRHHSQHVGHSKQHRDLLCDADHLQALQEENADLHQNLLQTVVCIESLEAELQRTRDELSHVKEKYKSLLQTHTGTKQANNILGEHLHIASESLSSERKYLLNRVSKLSAELEDAHRTIAALENINVPCLIKELLEKHFESAEAIQNFLMTSITNRHSTTSQADGQSHSPKADEGAHDWLTKSEAGLQRVTAFMPFKQGVPATGNEGSLSGQHELSYSPPFSVADISTAIYKKMAASYAARPQPVYPQSQQQPSLTPNHAETLPDFRQGYVGTDNWSGKGELKVALLEQDIEDVNSMSAQQILNDFMQHLQPHKEAGGRKEPQSGQKWASGVEQTGKVTD